MKYWRTKTVGEVRDYGLDWGPTLSKLGDPTVTESSWEKLRGGASCSATGSIDEDGQKVYTRVVGGDANGDTTFRNTVTLSNGLVLTEDVLIKTRA